ncbi:MAG: acetyltransferase [Bacteroidia bacterium]|nr:acetyltransferase [Bacteroidia bacterium]MDW8333493.1 acetyltransferase [Bacteroidia bacterium]
MEGIPGLIVFPCNGTGREALDAIDRPVVFVDDEKAGSVIFGVPVEGRTAFARLSSWRVLAVYGGPRTFRRRKATILGLGLDAERWATVVHPSAVVSKNARLGCNVYIGPHATIHAGATIADHVVVMAGAVVHHEATVERFAVVCAGTILAGETTVGEEAFVGAGACIRQGLVVGESALVGMGAVVVADVPPRSLVAGNPAKILRQD